MNTYADDLAALVRRSTSRTRSSSATRPVAARSPATSGGTAPKRVAKVVLIGAVPPLMLKTDANPAGLPIEAFDEIRAKVLADRSQFFKDLTVPFYGANRPGAKVSQGLLDSFWLQSMLGGLKNAVRLHQGVLGDRLHRGSEEVRRADADPARRRRPDRADRRRRPGLGEAGEGSEAGGVRGGAATGCARRTRTGSTRSCWRSSRSRRPVGRTRSPPSERKQGAVLRYGPLLRSG